MKYLTFFLLLSLYPDFVSAQSIFSLSGCTGIDCTACHVVNLANGIIQWLIAIVFLLFAALMMYAGIKLVTSAGNVSALSDAKENFINALIGFLIILSAWLIIDTIMRGLVGVAGDESSRGMLQSPGTAGVNGRFIWSRVECQTIETLERQELTAESFVDFTSDVVSVYDPATYSPALLDAASLPIPPQPSGQICYPGSGSGPVCFQAVTGIAGQTGYVYPSGYPVPPRWIDTRTLGGGRSMSTRISRNYTLGDLNVSGRCGNGGRYMYIDPSALASLEQVNSLIGSRLSINSAHRSPGCNSRVGGADASIHMSGRAFDLQPPGGDRCRVVRACRSAGANFIMTYSSTNHVHCDWRGGARTEQLTITCP